MAKFPLDIRRLFRRGVEIQVASLEAIIRSMDAQIDTCFDGEDAGDMKAFTGDLLDIIEGFKKCVMPTLGEDQ